MYWLQSSRNFNVTMVVYWLSSSPTQIMFIFSVVNEPSHLWFSQMGTHVSTLFTSKPWVPSTLSLLGLLSISAIYRFIFNWSLIIYLLVYLFLNTLIYLLGFYFTPSSRMLYGYFGWPALWSDETGTCQVRKPTTKARTLCPVALKQISQRTQPIVSNGTEITSRIAQVNLYLSWTPPRSALFSVTVAAGVTSRGFPFGRVNYHTICNWHLHLNWRQMSSD